MKVTALLLAIAAALSVLASAGASQQILNVPSQYKTIQAAIDAAQASDTVLVAPGTYQENIDFKGKAIRVRGISGAALTTIDGGRKSSVVTFASGEGSGSVIEGFSIVNGAATSAGGGVHCYCTSPVIRDNVIRFNGATGPGGGIYIEGGSPLVIGNIIRENLSFSPSARGGGICCAYTLAKIIDNVVSDNIAWGRSHWLFTSASGGGIYNDRLGVHIVNNVICGNLAYAEAANITGADAGGLFCWCIESRGQVFNNTICDNTAAAAKGNTEGGGARTYQTDMANCILWGNQASRFPQLAGAATYSCVQGDSPGIGNISADPRFWDAANGDFHLRFDSPCRNAGANVSGLPATDFEGDPRIADGMVDMGADEFFPHLYHMGTPTPAGTISVSFIGNPGTKAYWAFSHHVLNPPASIPGLKGLFYLNPVSIAILPLGQFPSTGVIALPYKFDPNFPKISIPMQALMGDQLSNLDIVDVR
jgi:hypothetical protein